MEDNYQRMVNEKIERQKAAGIETSNDGILIMKENGDMHIEGKNFKLNHSFEQSFITQESFEPRKFLFIKYNKKVRTLKEPTGLCLVCRKLEVEHE